MTIHTTGDIQRHHYIYTIHSLHDEKMRISHLATNLHQTTIHVISKRAAALRNAHSTRTTMNDHRTKNNMSIIIIRAASLCERRRRMSAMKARRSVYDTGEKGKSRKMLTERRRQTSKIITTEVDRQVISKAKVQDAVKWPDSLDRSTSDSNHSQSIKNRSGVTSD